MAKERDSLRDKRFSRSSAVKMGLALTASYYLNSKIPLFGSEHAEAQADYSSNIFFMVTKHKAISFQQLMIAIRLRRRLLLRRQQTHTV